MQTNNLILLQRFKIEKVASIYAFKYFSVKINSNTYLMCSFLQLYYTFTLLLRRMQIMKVDGGQQLSSSKKHHNALEKSPYGSCSLYYLK